MPLEGSIVPEPHTHRNVVRVGPRPGWSLTVEVATWDAWVIRVVHPDGNFVLCLPDGDVQAWLRSYDAGELDTELDQCVMKPPRRALRRLPRTVRRGIARRVESIGIEHEFEVRRGDQLVPFGSLIDGLGIEGVRADPADPNARRTDLGVVTVDGVEAEVATPPIPIRPGCSKAAENAARDLTAYLASKLAGEYRLDGVSTHVSVTWPARHADSMSRQWAFSFAPVVMLLMDLPTSPGLLVRPRPGRLELCGEHVVGDRLRAVVAVAAASVELLRDDPKACRQLAIRQRLEPAVARFGWYVDRTATGSDLYETGRSCTLVRFDGSPVSAGQQLRDVARLLTPSIHRCCGADDARLVHDFANGTLALGCEVAPTSIDGELTR